LIDKNSNFMYRSLNIIFIIIKWFWWK